MASYFEYAVYDAACSICIVSVSIIIRILLYNSYLKSATMKLLHIVQDKDDINFTSGCIYR